MERFEQYGDPNPDDEDGNALRIDDVDWDDNKEEDSNQEKHGISFEEAATCFRDPERRVFDSPTSKGGESRLLLYGTSAAGRPLVVVFTLRRTNRGTIARIISARRTR